MLQSMSLIWLLYQTITMKQPRNHFLVKGIIYEKKKKKKKKKKLHAELVDRDAATQGNIMR
jgi:hypothetical protein